MREVFFLSGLGMSYSRGCPEVGSLKNEFFSFFQLFYATFTGT